MTHEVSLRYTILQFRIMIIPAARRKKKVYSSSLLKNKITFSFLFFSSSSPLQDDCGGGTYDIFAWRFDLRLVPQKEPIRLDCNAKPPRRLAYNRRFTKRVKRQRSLSHYDNVSLQFAVDALPRVAPLISHPPFRCASTALTCESTSTSTTSSIRRRNAIPLEKPAHYLISSSPVLSHPSTSTPSLRLYLSLISPSVL